MAAIQVTTAGGYGTQHSFLYNTRVIVCTSTGIPYIIGIKQASSIYYVEVWAGNSSTPTSFSLQTQTNRPTSASGIEYTAVSAAIDSNGKIHICWHEANGNAPSLMYYVYDTVTKDDTGAKVDIVADTGAGSVPAPSTDIAIDSNNIPHVVCIQYNSNMGSTYSEVAYNNRVGGAWNASNTIIEGATAQKNCYNPSICIDADNKPCVAYSNGTDGAVTAAIGNANDASSFTLYDVDTGQTSNYDFSSIAVDSSGNHYIEYYNETNTYVYVIKHVKADAWTTWQTKITNNDVGVSSYKQLSLVLDGSDIYIFYLRVYSTVRNICYDKYTGTWGSGTWKGETVLYNTSSVNFISARWANLNNPSYTTYGIGYAFYRPSDDNLYYDYIALSQQISFACAKGSFNMTGQALTMKKALKLTAAKGSFTMTGQAVTFAIHKNYTIVASKGQYNMSGQVLTMKKALKATLANGNFSMTGQSAALKKALKIASGQGAYAYTGFNLLFKRGYNLIASKGDYTMAGQPLAMKKALKLLLGQGGFTIAGQTITMHRDLVIHVDPGYLTMTGQNVNLKKALKILTNYGSFTFTGKDVTLTYTPAGIAYQLTCAVGQFILTGEDLLLKKALKLAAAYGGYQMTGEPLTMKKALKIVASEGGYTMTGQGLSMKKALKMVASYGNYQHAGQSISMKKALKMVLAEGAYVIYGQNVGLGKGWKITLDTGNYSMDGKPLSMKKALKMGLVKGDYLMNGQAINLKKSLKAILDKGQYAMTGQDVQFKKALKITLSQGSFVITGEDVTLIYTPAGQHLTLVASTGHYSMDGQELVMVKALKMAMGKGDFTMTGEDIMLKRGYRLNPATGYYTLVGEAVDFRKALRMVLDQGNYVMTGEDIQMIISTVGLANLAEILGVRQENVEQFLYANMTNLKEILNLE